MSSSLEDVEFLSRSSTRVAVLEAVSETPRTRHELRERTGASRVTVNRILDDFEDRGWIDRENGRCETTARGDVVASEFERTLENLDAANELDGAISWLPTDEFEFDLAHLRDAEVIRTSSWEEHTATIREIREMVSRTSRIWGTAVGFSHEVVEAIREATTAGETTFDVVIDEATREMIRDDPGLRTRFEDVLASGHASMACYTGERPLDMVMVFDDTSIVCGHVEDGPPPGTVRTADETVRSWARSYYESALAASEPVDADAFAPEQSETS